MTKGTTLRKYALSKLSAGDWLLPANDGQSFWRIRQYEDGPSYGIEGWVRDRTLWGVWRWEGDLKELSKLLAVEEPDREPALWEFYDGTYARRSEAITAALKLAARE